MRYEKIYLSKMILSTLLISFILLSLVLFLDLQVSSQNEETVQNRNMFSKQQKKEDKDEGIQQFINILTRNNQEISASEKVDAIKRLGDAKAKRTIPILVKYLDYEDTSVLNRSLHGIDITEYNDVSSARRYPAIGSLVRMSKESLPALVEVLEKESLDSLRSKNARITIQYIFLRENVVNGILYLEKAASESKALNGSERLLKAAQEMRTLLEKVQQ